MSQSVPASKLPEQPSLEQLKKQAKDLRAAGAHASLAAAQRALAASYGYPSWPKLKLAVDLMTLRRLIENGDAQPVRRLLESSPRLARASFADGSTPLHAAAGENRPAVVQALVDHGAPLHARYGSSAHSPLSWAITCEAYDAAHALVGLGVKPDLFCASGLGLLDAVRAFWTDGTIRRHPSATGSSRYDEDGAPLPRPPQSDADQVSDALYIACRCNRIDVARWLLDRGADPNWRGYAGATCLAWAEFTGDAALCALLRERGGSDEVKDDRFQATPKAFGVMVLAGWGFAKRLLERLRADPSLVSVRGDRGTLLHAAADGGQPVVAKLLLVFGADRTAVDHQGRTPADIAAAKGHVQLAALLQPSR